MATRLWLPPDAPVREVRDERKITPRSTVLFGDRSGVTYDDFEGGYIYVMNRKRRS